MHMPEPLASETIRQHFLQGHMVLEVRGEVDILTAIHDGAFLDTVTEQSAAKLIIDLTPTQFIDCVGLSLLLRAQRRVTERGGTCAVVCPHPFTLRLIRVAGLTKRLRPVTTLEDALAAPHSTSPPRALGRFAERSCKQEKLR